MTSAPPRHVEEILARGPRPIWPWTDWSAFGAVLDAPSDADELAALRLFLCSEELVTKPTSFGRSSDADIIMAHDPVPLRNGDCIDPVIDRDGPGFLIRFLQED